MKVKIGFLFTSILSLACLVSLGVAGPDSIGKPASPESMEIWEKINAKRLEQRRIEKNREDLRMLQLVDSVGWKKVLAIRQPHQGMDQLEKEQVQRKTAALISFCDEQRFAKQTEVDSLEGMKADERTFCKNRLRLINPLMP